MQFLDEALQQLYSERYWPNMVKDLASESGGRSIEVPEVDPIANLETSGSVVNAGHAHILICLAAQHIYILVVQEIKSQSLLSVQQ